jgi:hypothetical protein
MRVEADLTIDIDGTPARLASDGDRLILSSAHPERIWAAAVSAALPAGIGTLDGPRAVGRMARELAAAGLRLEVTGPRGTVAHLGDGVRSRLGRAVTGSAAVAPGTPSAVAVLLWSRFPLRRAVITAVALSAAIAVVARRRR